MAVTAERILNADLRATTAVRLAASTKNERYVLNYKNYQDAKNTMLREALELKTGAKITHSMEKMEEVQGDIEEAEARAIALIGETKWEEALELVTEPSYMRLKSVYRANLSGALLEMIKASRSRTDRSSDIARSVQLGVLCTLGFLALVGILYSRAMQQAKTAAELAAQAKSDFLLAMGHELRTPINQIIGYSELIAEEAEDAGRADLLSDSNKIRQAGQGLLAMITDVLDLSDFESGALTVTVEEFDVADMIAGVETYARPLMEANRNAFSVIEGAEIGTMQSDKVKIRRCLEHLLSNATKFTEAGRVELRVESTDDGALEFRVMDTGIGMTPEECTTLFDAFVQGESGATRTHDGAGLGLAITRRFCAELGGQVTVESEPGEGSVFTIRLPAIIPEPDALEQS